MWVNPACKVGGVFVLTEIQPQSGWFSSKIELLITVFWVSPGSWELGERWNLSLVEIEIHLTQDLGKRLRETPEFDQKFEWPQHGYWALVPRPHSLVLWLPISSSGRPVPCATGSNSPLNAYSTLFSSSVQPNKLFGWGDPDLDTLALTPMLAQI